jgi:prevent-host-death family protein
MYYMETTAREFNQNASRILAAAERGERITVTKNGRPVAILSPVSDGEAAPVPPCPTDPMGEDDEAPVFHSESPADWSAGRGTYLEGFGA